jgi:hypothetical protein
VLQKNLRIEIECKDNGGLHYNSTSKATGPSRLKAYLLLAHNLRTHYNQLCKFNQRLIVKSYILLFFYMVDFFYCFLIQAHSIEPKDLEVLKGNAIKPVVNIVVPPDGLGGFGDLTSNLYMAEKLVEQGFNANVFIPDSFQDKFRILSILNNIDFASFFWGNRENINYFSIPKQGTKVSGIDFCEALPESSPFTSYVSFSSLDLNTPYKAKEKKHSLPCFIKNKSFPNAAIFSEYIGVAEYLGKIIKKSQKPSPFLAWNNINGVVLPTGPLSLGMYISPNKPWIAKQKNDIIREFFDVSVLKSKLSFSYTASYDAASIYLEALNDFANKNQDTTFFLIAKHRPQIALAKNLHVETIPNLSFQKTKEIIASSDFPLMVTGDMSLTLAMDYEKEFFYEALNHKFRMEENLRLFDQLKELPDLSIPAERVQVHALGSSATHEIKPMKREKLKEMVINTLQWFSNNPSYMSDGINAIRAHLSLPAKFSNSMSALLDNNPAMLWGQMPISSIDGLWEKSIDLWLKSKKYEKNFALNLASKKSIYVLKDLYENQIGFHLIWADGTSDAQNHFNLLWEKYKLAPYSWEAQEYIIPEIGDLLFKLKPNLIKLELESDIATRLKPI